MADPVLSQQQISQTSIPDYAKPYVENLLGQAQLASGDAAGARATFALLAKAPWSDYKLAAQIASGRILIAENKLDEAVKEFDRRKKQKVHCVNSNGVAEADLRRASQSV